MEETPYKTFKKGNQILEIYQDNDPQSPRSWDNFGSMVCFHGRYRLGDDDKHGLRSNDFSSWQEMKQFIDKKLKAEVILPIYMYDHSGLTIKTSPFDCRWDSGQIGFIFVTKKQIRENFNVKRVTKELIDKSVKILEAEIETYDQYLTGDVYGFKLKTVSMLADGNEEGEEETDSCWGFYGTDWKTNGIFDHVEGKFEEWVEVK